MNSLTDIVVQGKRFISVGRPGGGVNFSGDIFAGIVIDELAGPTTNWSFSFGVVSITVFTDPAAGIFSALKGITVGGGPTLPCPPCIGFSTTRSNTETIETTRKHQLLPRPPKRG